MPELSVWVKAAVLNMPVEVLKKQIELLESQPKLRQDHMKLEFMRKRLAELTPKKKNNKYRISIDFEFPPHMENADFVMDAVMKSIEKYFDEKYNDGRKINIDKCELKTYDE